MKYLSQPCPSCPWRIDQTAGDIPHFDLEKARCLSRTCSDSKGFGPSFGEPMFACHTSNEREEFPCAGWLAKEGSAHPMVRLAIMTNALPEKVLSPGDNWPELHDNYVDVLTKLENS